MFRLAYIVLLQAFSYTRMFLSNLVSYGRSVFLCSFQCNTSIQSLLDGSKTAVFSLFIASYVL